MLRRRAEKDGQSVQQVVDKAVRAYERQRFFDEINAAYARVQADPEAWAEELAERAEWDAVLADGLEDA